MQAVRIPSPWRQPTHPGLDLLPPSTTLSVPPHVLHVRILGARENLVSSIRSGFTVRSYELDSFGHLNHAVFLNFFEQARFDALEACGFPIQRVLDLGWAIYVVRIEVDYLAQAFWDDALTVETWVEEVRRSSMTLAQEVTKADGTSVASARVVGVWIGPDGQPMRMPEDLRSALGSLARE